MKLDYKFLTPIAITLISTLISFSISYAVLNYRVNAVDEEFDKLVVREQKNKDQFDKLVECTHEIKETVIKIETNQNAIMKKLGL